MKWTLQKSEVRSKGCVNYPHTALWGLRHIIDTISSIRYSIYGCTYKSLSLPYGTEHYDACFMLVQSFHSGAKRLLRHLHRWENISFAFTIALASLDMWVCDKREMLKIITRLPWEHFRSKSFARLLHAPILFHFYVIMYSCYPSAFLCLLYTHNRQASKTQAIYPLFGTLQCLTSAFMLTEPCNLRQALCSMCSILPLYSNAY